MADGAQGLTEKLGLPLWAQRFLVNPLAAVIAVSLLPLHVLLAGLQKMRDILGIMIFLGVGVLIAAAVVWYGAVVYQWWNASSGPPSIGAMTVLGLEDARTKAVSAALPAMILAELKRVGGRTNEAKRQLRDLEATQTQGTTPQDPRFAPVAIPENLKTDVAIPQQIAGVEIGWLLTWIKDLLAPTNVIDLTISFDTDRKKASVFGNAKGKSGYAFFFQDETGRPEEIARAVAAAVIQQEQRRGEIAVQPLSPADYLPVVNALSTYATYEKVVRSWREQQGRPDFTAEYKAELASIGTIAEANTHWAELQWLAAEIAERAGDRTKALAFTINEQRLTPRDDSRYGRLAARLERLSETKVASASAPTELDDSRTAAGMPLDAKYADPIKKLLGIPRTVPDHSHVRIASILVPWSQARKGARTKTLRESPSQDESLTDYATSVMQVNRIVAPNATYEFAGVSLRGSNLREEDIISALADIARSQPDIIQHSFSASASVLSALQPLASQMVIVVAAGNEKGTSNYAPIEDVVLVVGATDLTGSPTSFSSSSPKAVWAPGLDIPVVSPSTGELTRSAGTSYSAALVAGAAALLKAAHPSATPQQIVAALRDTAKATPPGTARMINIDAALEQLRNPARAGGGS